MKKNIFFWGAKYKAGIIYNFIKKNELVGINKNLKVSFLFDPGLKRPQFKSEAKFSNKQKDLAKFIKSSNFFFNLYWQRIWKSKARHIQKVGKKITSYKYY